MIPLVFSLWREMLDNPTSQDEKIMALASVLQVYAALLGMTDAAFQDLTHQIGEVYSGPLPDVYSQEILDYYEGIPRDE